MNSLFEGEKYMCTERVIDCLGRIVLPSDIRKGVGIHSGTKCSVSVCGDSIVIKRAVPVCKICGMPVDEESEYVICDDCIHDICSYEKEKHMSHLLEK